MIRLLQWDSAFFGIKIGEWIADESRAEGAEDFDLIYAKSQKELFETIPGFRKEHSEVKVVFGKKLRGTFTTEENILPFKESGCTLEELYELAYESGKYSRFKVDPNFGDEGFRKLYRTWIDNSLTGHFATEILVYRKNNKAAGFVTYKTGGNKASIGLIAVSKDYQGEGIGKKLLQYTEAKLIQEGIKEVEIPTQEENRQACNFYKKQGYSIIQKTHITHFWKK